ncbi:hypothetical protein TruAng_011783 [Truncatella angustata]|nr:hypothetical protein TruAng_011783 [Truncatella angustata]
MALLRRVSAEDEIQLVKLVTAVVFLLSLPFRLWAVRRLPPKVSSGSFGLFKAVIALLLPLYQILLVIEWFGWPGARGFVNAAAPITSVVAACGYWVLSLIEQKRSTKPSTPISLFLSANLICDLAELGLASRDTRRYVVATTTVLLDLVLLVVESLNKRKGLIESSTEESPEGSAGVLSRTFFWWINPILAIGYRKTLRDADVPSLDRALSSASLRKNAIMNWEKRGRPGTSTTLPRVLLHTLLTPFLLVVPPRIFLTTFRYSQPLLIREAIRYLGAIHQQEVSVDSFNIIAAAVIIYVGLAISGAVYQHRLNRLTVMTRGVLVSLIHHKTLHAGSNTLSEGKVVTLMSNDVDSLIEAASMFHETWAQVVEVTIGIVLLASEVGWLWPLPLIFIFCCSRISQYVARHLRARQGAWNAATQDRISMTSTVLSAIKNIKMLGLQASATSYIDRLRRAEITTASKVRWMMFVYNASANALGIFAPVITLVLYAVVVKLQGRRLDAEAAFTTTAILGMVTHPANMVMTIVPRAIASFSSFERIQNFLVEPDLDDSRTKRESIPDRTTDLVPKQPAISFQQVLINSSTSKVLLQDVTFDVPHGSFFICAGPTASGKTTLAQAILGEIPASRGTISIASKRVGYCAQTVWLPSTTIKQAILSFSRTQEADDSWYAEVLRICCLQQDLDNMPDGDMTLVGSRGMSLSGGQRQRIALARALYARPAILLLDDTLSGLDGNTEGHIVDNLFGPDGFIRRLGMTVFLITNAAQHFNLADRILVLEEARIKEQGSWDELQSKQQQIEKLVSKSAAPYVAVNDRASTLKQPGIQNKSALQKKADDRRSDGDSALYGYYVKSVGYGNLALLVACTASYSFFGMFPQYWLKLWTDSESTTTWFYATGYVLLTFMAWSTTNGLMWTTIMRMAPHSGLTLHSRLLIAIMRAPLSYFSSTETGEILNRFSQDMQLVDKQLAPALQSVLVQTFKLTVQFILLFLASKYMTISLPFCCIAVYIIQRVYLRTSRQLRLLELESRSAIFSDFLETVEGVTTIRAFQAQTKAEVDHLLHLDASQRPFYLLSCLQRWLKIVLDLLVAAIGVGVIALAVALRGSTRGSQIGLALNMILVVNATLLSLVQSWTNLEISLGAISRLKTLEEDVISEDDCMDNEESYTLKPWPEPGAVELHSITAAYNQNTVALQDFSLEAKPGQLVVLCGRTGSLRFNIDPSESFGNDTIKETLDRVQLLHHFCVQGNDHVDNTGSEQVQNDESNERLLGSILSSLPQLSAGQTQLLAVGRALLQARNIAESGYKPIILLDEATSSLDTDTERLILSIIREEFTAQGYTVIMVAHRLGAVKEIMREGIDKMVEM